MQCFKKRLAKVLIFICLFFVVDEFCGFLLEPANYFGHFTNKDLEDAKGRIDTVFLGSSWTYLAYNCEQFDNMMGTTSFNAGSSGQTVIDSFYYLREIVKNNPIKTVYFNISHLKLQYPKNRYSSTVVNDRLKGINRLEHMIAASDETLIGYYLNAFRYRDTISQLNIVDNIRTKLSQEYRNDQWPKDDSGQTYSKMGYVKSDVEIIQGNNENFTLVDSAWKISDIKSYNLNYFFEIINFCRENEIELILVTPPFSMGFLQSVEDYQGYTNYMNDLVEENQITFVDFNLLKNSPFVQDALFTDTTHLNSKGAAIFTEMVANYTSDPMSVNFYDQITERPELYSYCAGVKLNVKRYSEDVLLEAVAANTINMDLEYRFLQYKAETNSWVSLQEYSPNNIMLLRQRKGLQKGDYYLVECRVIGSEVQREAYSALGSEDHERAEEVVFYGTYKPEMSILSLEAGSGGTNVEFQFLQWQEANNWKVIKEPSKEKNLDVKVVEGGMYRFKVRVRAYNTQNVLAETDYFVDTSEYLRKWEK